VRPVGDRLLSKAPLPGWPIRLAGVAALLSAAAGAVDLLDGADARWATAADLLLVPPAIALLVEVRRAQKPQWIVALAALGLLVGPIGALLGDTAGASAQWSALAAAWWCGVASGAAGWRPGLALLSALAAAASALAAGLLAISVPMPLLSLAGARAAFAVAWAAWAGLDLLLRPRFLVGLTSVRQGG
jgi:hypothetical protein